MGRIIWSRLRLRFARALLIAGKGIIEAEQSRWDVVPKRLKLFVSPPAPSGRVPAINPKGGARRK
jgi:hypothetical protein